jgi:hypothetical protein
MCLLRQPEGEEARICTLFFIWSTFKQAAWSRRYRLLWIAAAPGRMPGTRKLLRQRPLSAKNQIIIGNQKEFEP